MACVKWQPGELEIRTKPYAVSAAFLTLLQRVIQFYKELECSTLSFDTVKKSVFVAALKPSKYTYHLVSAATKNTGRCSDNLLPATSPSLTGKGVSAIRVQYEV